MVLRHRHFPSLGRQAEGTRDGWPVTRRAHITIASFRWTASGNRAMGACSA